MKQVSFRLSDEEYNKLNTARGDDKWHKFILNMLDGSTQQTTITPQEDHIENIKSHLLDQMQEKHELHQDQHNKLHDRINALENYHHQLLRAVDRLQNKKPVNFQALQERRAILKAINQSIE